MVVPMVVLAVLASSPASGMSPAVSTPSWARARPTASSQGLFGIFTHSALPGYRLAGGAAGHLPGLRHVQRQMAFGRELSAGPSSPSTPCSTASTSWTSCIENVIVKTTADRRPFRRLPEVRHQGVDGAVNGVGQDRRGGRSSRPPDCRPASSRLTPWSSGIGVIAIVLVILFLG